MSTQTTTDMKQAFSSAARFIAELVPGASDIRLEEISARPGKWDVVLSYEAGRTGTFSSLVNGRVFKLIEIERETGEPLALRVWKA